jgi:hypothetical protein
MVLAYSLFHGFGFWFDNVNLVRALEFTWYVHRIGIDLFSSGACEITGGYAIVGLCTRRWQKHQNCFSRFGAAFL